MRPILASTLLLSSILLPAAAHASKTADDATAATPEVRVSTGVTAPKLTQPISINLPEGISKAFIPSDTKLELSFTVDSLGKAQNVKVTKSISPYWDARVIEAIQKSQFNPGKLDDQAIPVDMNLVVSLMR
jgi:Gram-negative bacterial tonB protein.